MTVSSPDIPVTAQCTVNAVAPTTGEVWISRTTIFGGVQGASAALDHPVTQPPTVGFEPAFFTSVSPGTHSANATALADYSVQVGQCQFSFGGNGCNVTSFTTATCTNRNCALNVAVSAGVVRKVVFLYTQVPLSCTPASQTVAMYQDVGVSAVGGADPMAWSAPGGAPSSGTGRNFLTRYATPGVKTITVTSVEDESAQCTVNVAAPTTGDLWITRTAAPGLSIDGTVANIDASVTQPGALSYNPAYFVTRPPGTHSANASALAGYVVEVGQCDFGNGIANCNVTSFAPANCANGNCALDVPVLAGRVRKVEFRYTRLGWSGWRADGGSVAGIPAAVAVGPGSYEVFARGSDNTLQHCTMISEQPCSWENLGGAIAGDPAVVSGSGGRLDVFARGTDNLLKHRAWTGSAWTAWETVGKDKIQGTPTAVRPSPNLLDVYWRKSSSSLRHATFDGSKWSTVKSLGSGMRSDPVAVSWGGGRVDVFWRGTKDKLRHRAFDQGRWRSVETLAKNDAGTPAGRVMGPGAARRRMARSRRRALRDCLRDHVERGREPRRQRDRRPVDREHRRQPARRVRTEG